MGGGDAMVFPLAAIPSGPRATEVFESPEAMSSSLTDGHPLWEAGGSCSGAACLFRRSAGSTPGGFFRRSTTCGGAKLWSPRFLKGTLSRRAAGAHNLALTTAAGMSAMASMTWQLRRRWDTGTCRASVPFLGVLCKNTGVTGTAWTTSTIGRARLSGRGTPTYVPICRSAGGADVGRM